jgi:hypothetical protein
VSADARYLLQSGGPLSTEALGREHCEISIGSHMGFTCTSPASIGRAGRCLFSPSDDRQLISVATASVVARSWSES